MKSQQILYSKSNKKIWVYMYLYIHTHTYTYTYIIHTYTYTYTYIQTYIHAFTYIHRHIHIPAWASVHTETRQIICLSKMHEKHPQKTHMLSEVADQRPANSIKISFPTGTPPHTPPKQITHPAPTKTNPQTGKG